VDERYGAFLVRCWHRADGAWRVVIEHVQSGERARLASVAEAAAWLAARTDDAAEGHAERDRGHAQQPPPRANC
jgi:hypothetical protein